MVTTTQIEFVALSRVYVTNKLYPSIHVYTTNQILIDYLVSNFNARDVIHKGTHDIVVSRRDELEKAAKLFIACGDLQKVRVGKTLLRYCRTTKTKTRITVARRLSRQIILMRERAI